MSKQFLTYSKIKLLSFVRGFPLKRSNRQSSTVSTRSSLKQERYNKPVLKCGPFQRQPDAAGRRKFGKPQDRQKHKSKFVGHPANEKHKKEERNIESNLKELCHKSKGLDNRQKNSSLNRVRNNIKTRSPDRPNLSDVQNSNFRFRLYSQLNVVQLRSKKLLFDTRGLHSELPKLCSGNRKYERDVQRSMPIAMKSFVRHDGNVDLWWAEHYTCQTADSLDTGDIFKLDI